MAISISIFFFFVQNENHFYYTRFECQWDYAQNVKPQIIYIFLGFRISSIIINFKTILTEENLHLNFITYYYAECRLGFIKICIIVSSACSSQY